MPTKLFLFSIFEGKKDRKSLSSIKAMTTELYSNLSISSCSSPHEIAVIPEIIMN